MIDLARRNALVALLIVAPVPAIGAAASVWIWPGTAGSFVYGILKGYLYLLPVVWLLFVDHEPASWSPPRKGGFAVGAVLGVAIAVFILAVWFLAIRSEIDPEPFRQVARSNSFDTPLKFLLFGGFIIALNSVMEEYVFRWFVFTRCRRLVSTLPAVVLSALIFTAHHVVLLRAYVPWGLTLEASAGVFVGGIAWSWMYHRYGSIWPGCVSHMLVDVAIIVIGWQVLFTL